MQAAYVLYNGPDLDLSAFGNSCGRLPLKPESFGVTLLAASVAKELVDRRQEEFGTVARFSRPWSCLVGCGWSECGHKDQPESELWVKGRGDLSEWAAVSYQHIEGRRRTAPVRADTSELGLRNQPPDYVVPLLGQDATAPPTGAGPNLRLPPRVGALTIFRPAG
jgi:hypothetical protein